MLKVMYAFYLSTVLIALLRLSAVSAVPTPDTSVIPQVQTCTTSWNPGESDPQGLAGYCEYEDVNCDKSLSVMPTTLFGEIGCSSRKRLILSPFVDGDTLVLTLFVHEHGKENGQPTPCCLQMVKCGYLRQGHCQNREKSCVGGSYSVAEGSVLVALFFSLP